MKLKGLIFLLIVSFCGILFAEVKGSAAAKNADEILGEWKTKPGDHGFATVRIEKKDGKYFGSIVKLSEPNYPADDTEGMGGKIKVDRKNPDKSLRAKPLVGIQLLKNFVHKKKNKWKDGTVYDPENGKTYKCNVTLKEDGVTLKVRGYIGFSFIGRSTVWKRVSTN